MGCSAGCFFLEHPGFTDLLYMKARFTWPRPAFLTNFQMLQDTRWKIFTQRMKSRSPSAHVDSKASIKGPTSKPTTQGFGVVPNPCTTRVKALSPGSSHPFAAITALRDFSAFQGQRTWFGFSGSCAQVCCKLMFSGRFCEHAASLSEGARSERSVLIHTCKMLCSHMITQHGLKLTVPHPPHKMQT